MSWKLREGLRKRLNGEKGAYVYAAGARSRMALIYPNSYFVGMSNLGMHIIYKIMNDRPDTACERFFLPEKAERQEYEKTNTPLMSVETQTSLTDFPLIAFAISFEMDYFNILDILKLGRIKLLAEERGPLDPIVIAGGPCATFNPQPLSKFIDAFIIGEGEETMLRFMDTYYAAVNGENDREAVLRELAKVPGVYVPSLYEHEEDENGNTLSIKALDGAPEHVSRQWVRNLDDFPGHTVVETADTEFNLYLVETARGCGRHCRFCMAGYCFRKPRNRSMKALEKMLMEAKKAEKRVGLMGAAISDYPEIDELCSDILGDGLEMSVASFRADSVTKDLVEALAKSGLRTLTMAPEAGSSRMRAVINKGIEEEHLFHAMSLGLEAGIYNYRLYIMVGLPYEEDSDIDSIIDMAVRLREYMNDNPKARRGILTLSINPFIPKPFTPFQWLPMASIKDVQNKLKHIRTSLKKVHGVEVIAESPKEAAVQEVLARGGRIIGDVLLKSHEKGGAKAFKSALKEMGLSLDTLIEKSYDKNEILPWDSLDMGFTKEYLYNELKRAEKLQPTPRCFDGCKRCGVCR